MSGLDGAQVVAIILAAGSGERMGGGEPKAFRRLGDRTLLALSSRAASETPEVDAVVIACPPGMQQRAADEAAEIRPTLAIVPGGATRQASVFAALAELPSSCRIVVCHDAARPLARPALFTSVIRELDTAPSEIGAVVPVVPVADTIKRVADDEVIETVPRADLRAAQTPQAFRAPDLIEAHARATAESRAFTDDAAAIEWAGGRVRVIAGDDANMKITTERDLQVALALLAHTRHD